MKDAAGKGTPAPHEDITEKDLPVTEEDKKVAASMPVRNLIGKLWWVARVSRPDIVCALHKCAVWQNRPSQKLWKHLIWIVKYLKTTQKVGITFNRKKEGTSNYVTYCDAAYATEEGTYSRVGFVYYFLGGLVAWESKKTKTIVDSSTEAECQSVVQALNENEYVRQFVEELGIFSHTEPTIIYQDNKSTIALTRQGAKHKRSKHYEVAFNKCKEHVRKGKVEMKHVSTTDQIADMFTKSLPQPLFEKLRDRMMRGDIENVLQVNLTVYPGDEIRKPVAMLLDIGGKSKQTGTRVHRPNFLSAKNSGRVNEVDK